MTAILRFYFENFILEPLLINTSLENLTLGKLKTVKIGKTVLLMKRKEIMVTQEMKKVLIL